jgi:hypothetical protein
LPSQGRCGTGRFPARKRPPGKACQEGKKVPPGVDLFTEIRTGQQVLCLTGVFTGAQCNSLIFNCLILFKYCTEMKIALSDGHLGFSLNPYSQSYPQNLWVSSFLFYSNSLRAYAKVFSSIDRQASDPA